MLIQAALVLLASGLAYSQRPFFAGSKPIGYPQVIRTTTESLDNRFGEGDSSSTTTTQRLPIEANGDRELVDRLSKLPIDQQPFWLLNWQALEAHRKNPQTYPQKPNVFAEPLNPSLIAGSNADISSNSGVNSNSGSKSDNPTSANNPKPNDASLTDLANRFSGITNKPSDSRPTPGDKNEESKHTTERVTHEHYYHFDKNGSNKDKPDDTHKAPNTGDGIKDHKHTTERATHEHYYHFDKNGSY